MLTPKPLTINELREIPLVVADANIPTVGQKASAASSPVVLASDQSPITTQGAIATASGTITAQNLVPAGTATANSAVEITMGAASSLSIQTTGVYTGALSLQATVDGTTWVTLGSTPFINCNTGGYLATITSALQSLFQAEAGGFIKARITALAAVTGTATVTIRGTAAPSMVALDAPLPAGAAIIGALSANQSSNIAQMNGVAVTMGNGTSGTGVQRVAVASDNTANSNPWLATLSPSAAQGASTTHHAISAATTNATSVKASAGTIAVLQVSNINAAGRYLKLYNKASAPTVGTDTPVMTIYLPPNSNQSIAAAQGLRFSTGIAYALSTGITVADTGAVAVSEHSVSIFYT